MSKKLVPELRFPEFENDGEWRKTTIDAIAKVSAGGTPESTNPEYWNGNLPWMNSGELNNKRIYSVSNYITSKGLKESSTKLIPPNCVLIGLAGQGKTRGTAAINYIELCTNQSIGSIHPNEDVFDSEFLYQKVDSMYEQLRYLSAGDGGRGGLNLQIIKDIELFLPKLKEQQKIASCLSFLDEVISAHGLKLDLLRGHKKGLIQNLFPQEGSTVPKYRFTEFNKDREWCEQKLGAIGDPLMCKRIFKEQTTDSPKNGIPFYKIGTFGKNPDSYIPIELYKDFRNKHSFPNVGDILISAAGTVGRLVVYDGSPAYFQDSNIVWLGNDERVVLNDFLFHYYSKIKWQTSDGGIISRLYNSDLKNMILFFPKNKTEQQKIAACLSSIDELVKAQTEKIEQLKLYKKGLMQRLFPKLND